MASSFTLTANLVLDASKYRSGATQAATATDTITAAAKGATGPLNATAGAVKKIGSEASTTTGRSKAMKSSFDDAAKSTKKLDDNSKSLKGSLGAVKGVLGGVVAIKIAQFAKGAIDSFNAVNESVNAVNVVFGDAAETITNFGKTSAQSVGLAQGQYQQMAAQVGQLLTGFGVDVDQAAQLTNTLAVRSADMASVMNKDVSEALGAVQSALRGETEPIRAFIGSMSQAEVQAFAVEQGMIAQGAALEGSAKALATVEFIMSRTNNLAGDFANTSDELANKARITAAEWENQKAVLGEAIAPMYERLLDLSGQLIPVLGTVAGVAGDFATGLGAVIDFIAALDPKILIAIGAIGALIAAFKYLNTVMTFISAHPVAITLGLVALAITAIGTAAANEKANVDKFKDELADLGDVSDQAFTDQLAGHAKEAAAKLNVSMGTVSRLVRGSEEDFRAWQRQMEENNLSSGENMDMVRLLAEHIGNLRDDYGEATVAADEEAAAEMRAAEAASFLAVAKQHGSDAAAAATQAAIDEADALDEEAVAAGLAGDDIRLHAQALQHAFDAYETATAGADGYRTAVALALEEQRSLAQAMLEFSDPVARAAGAMERLQEAQQHLADTSDDPKASAEDLAAAELEVFTATLEAQGALDAFDASGIEAQIGLVGDVLGVSDDEARNLLETLGLLDGTEVNTVINIRQRLLEENLTGTGARGPQTVRQHGGPTVAGQPYLVGEAGPELFVSRDSGTIHSNQALRTMFTAAPSGQTNSVANTWFPNASFGADQDTVRRGVQRALLTAGITEMVAMNGAGL